ncbi:sigma-70 family RNA polymerase sigma factor [Pullulanibacillus pueri]|uniref:sigma-70 family RNA polymerase sigma factor n=1 Tax=Pullulanibacillus pueri TaxID=1437324 RepID=UPI00227AD02B
MYFEQAYRDYYSLLFSIAYRFLGTVSEAEDIVHDVFVSLESTDWSKVKHPQAFLSKAVSNRCINVMKSAAKKKEVYVGTWLPEPFYKAENEPLDHIKRQEEMSYAYLVMLEVLSPLERVVYVLRESYSFSYKDLSETIGKTEANCRQLYSRAHRKIGRTHISEAKNTVQPIVAEQFIQALKQGNISELVKLVTEDTVIQTDGGGKTRAATRSISGIQRIFAFFKGIWSKGSFGDEQVPIKVNDEVAMMVVENAAPKAIWLFDVNPDTRTVMHIYGVLNPDKLPKII